MKSFFLVVSFATIIPYNLIGAEPSAFGAGDLNNPNPYGLTSNETVILQNKKNLHKIVVKSNNQENKVESIKDRLDGLQTVLEGLIEKTHKNKISIKNLDKKNSKVMLSADEYEKRLSKVTQINTQVNQNNAAAIEKIKLIISELSTLLDSINKTYVTKDELNALVNDVNAFKVLVTKELKKSVKPKKLSLKNMSNPDIAKKARAFYDKKYYTKSIEYYSYLIDVNYKPARAHYMIGEMNYYRKNYANAIAYFKKSASLYSKSSYMPILMLHTAVAMDKTGDKKNAKSFYEAIIAKYPDSEYTKNAKKFLKAMK